MSVTNSGDGQGAYVRRVQEETQKYLQDLLGENERLRAAAATIESERMRLLERTAHLEEELNGREHDQKLLKRQLAEIERENRRFSEQYVEVEQQNSNLANLYVASYRLHGTLDRDEVLSIIQEILINLVGSEEIALFEVSGNEPRLTLMSSFGIDAEQFRSISVGEGIIGGVARSGQAYLAGALPPESTTPAERWLTAAIPLCLPGRVIGVIAVFRLLEQKPGLGDLDREMFDLLATQAATALYCTTLHRDRTVAEGQVS